MRLHDVKVGRNKFCGPAAISAITGREVDEVVETFHALFPGKKVMGTHTWEVNSVLAEYGLSLRRWTTGHKWTLARWLRECKGDRTPGRLFLLAAGHHWVVISGRRAVCGKTKQIVSVAKYPHRRKRVAEAWLVEGEVKRTVPPPTKALQKLKAHKKRAYSRTRSEVAKAKRLAGPYGIQISREDDYWLVDPPEGAYSVSEGDGLPEDPFEDDHIAWEPSEVLEKVEAYITMLKSKAVSTPIAQPTVSQTAVTKVG
jgi:hypothetical protein